MTIEALIHIYTLLQADVDEKEATLREVRKLNRKWDDEHPDVYDPNPYDGDEDKAQRDYNHSNHILKQFASKEWN